MIRKHKGMGFKPQDVQLLQSFTDDMSKEKWTLLPHSVYRIKSKGGDELERVMEFIRTTELRTKDIFEAYFEKQSVLKACYRVPYSDSKDMILVVAVGRGGTGKELVTFYFNSKQERHFNLNRSLYGRR